MDGRTNRLFFARADLGTMSECLIGKTNGVRMVIAPWNNTAAGDSALAALPADWLVPQWPAPAWVRAVASSRTGGVSLAPYNSMNLGDHVEDDPASVARNRQIWQQLAGVRSVFLQQVHGVEVAELDDASTQASSLVVADAACTGIPGVACTIQVADCLPVLMCHARQRIVGAAHAGWRSLAGQQGQGVLERLLQKLQALCPAADDDGWMAWLGPCIGPRAFEVGDEVHAAFVQTQPAAAACFVAQPAAGNCGKWLADLAGLARLRLAAMGVQAVYGNNSRLEWCTFSQSQRFFSYRRDGRTGRMAAAIWLQSPDG